MVAAVFETKAVKTRIVGQAFGGVEKIAPILARNYETVIKQVVEFTWEKVGGVVEGTLKDWKDGKKISMQEFERIVVADILASASVRVLKALDAKLALADPAACRRI